MNSLAYGTVIRGSRPTNKDDVAMVISLDPELQWYDTIVLRGGLKMSRVPGHAKIPAEWLVDGTWFVVDDD